jgi:protein-tyrosine kinase
MTVGATDDAGIIDLQEELRRGLVALCRLSDDDVSRIEQEMLERQLPFGRAAVACGIVTQLEFQKALAWAQQIAQRGSWGVIETALRDRAITPRYWESVKPGPQLTLVHDPYSPRSERIRGLRTELLLLESKRKRSTALAVVSARAVEGRSLLVADLAVAFAQLGRRTLLVDADLRRPGLHALFGAENNWGLAQALSLAEQPRICGVEGLPHLSLLLSGPAVPNPLELLSDGRLARQIGEWRHRFDYILMDTPPVSEYSDAVAIATIVGSVLVISRAASTVYGDIKDMLRRLGGTQAQIVGAVLNHF